MLTISNVEKMLRGILNRHQRHPQRKWLHSLLSIKHCVLVVLYFDFFIQEKYEYNKKITQENTFGILIYER